MKVGWLTVEPRFADLLFRSPTPRSDFRCYADVYELPRARINGAVRCLRYTMHHIQIHAHNDTGSAHAADKAEFRLSSTMLKSVARGMTIRV
jgi:hypothetical protein